VLGFWLLLFAWFRRRRERRANRPANEAQQGAMAHGG
jgi:hypothetical protein